MVNTGDKSPRRVDISPLWQYIFDSALAVQARSLPFLYSYSSRNSSRFSALAPDTAPETGVLRRRPPKPLLEHPPKRTTFYMLLSRRKFSKCV